MKRYDNINNMLGWLAFAIAAFTYCMTIEPTASFWDCPEFITSGYKLEIGHPPGAPFFMLTANFFTLFTSDVTQIAKMVNTMNALLSAACILFLFWTITALVRKLIAPKDEDMTTAKLISIMGAGMVGALAYTWSDTFWFSAVEGEVYAYSSMFTALVFWLILKWERRADEPHSDKWLVLIGYLMGLSIGVHLLNLLCIPAIVLVYYYKKKANANLKGSLLALLGSAIIVCVVLYGVVPGIVKVGGWFELLFVNTLSLPFNTGLVIYIICLVSCILWGVYETYKDTSKKRQNYSFLLTIALLGIPFYGFGYSSVIIGLIVLAALGFYLFKVTDTKYSISTRVLNTTLLTFMMMVVGYSSYALIVIRSTANTPMDQNSPEDIFTLGEYLGREQYGSRPLFYGQTYASKPKIKQTNEGYIYDIVEGAPVYQRKEKKTPDEKDSYEVVRNKMDYNYAQNMLFPRMYSSLHAQAYEDWLGGVKGTMVPYDEAGQTTMLKIPTQWDNIKFFFIYQINYMYFRYFMWNFAGRQNDMQGQGEVEHGNWITGISFIDDYLIGNSSLMPSDLKNKGHNVFYCFPLILGIIGMFWQSSKGEEGVRQFWVVFFLFFMTGLAIVLYLNQTPQQPRERDYAYAGSFYAFAIWIGIGAAALADMLSKKMNPKLAASIASVIAILVPIQMVSQTWDDHDRSGRYTCRDFGQNYLNTLPENNHPIIYTNGDNDTFPLWYNQEVENVRTDARVCNLSYLQTDWYIDQMRRPAYKSPSLPINWKRYDYVAGKNEMVYIDPTALKTLMDYSENKEELKKTLGDNPYELHNILEHWVKNPISEDLHIIPTDSIVIKVDKEAVKRSGMMIPDSIPDYMHISLKGKRGLDKTELMILEMIDQTRWERPIYIASTVGTEYHLNLTNYFVQEGLAYRITPFDVTKTGKRVDTEKMYTNLMAKYKFGGIDNPNVYLDETVLRMCDTHRRLFILLANQLIEEGKNDKALKALTYCEKVIPSTTVPHDFLYSQSGDMAKCFIKLGAYEQAKPILKQMADNSVEYITWYLSFNQSRFVNSAEDCLRHLYILDEICKTMNLLPKTDKSNMAKVYTSKLNQLTQIFEQRAGKLQ